MDVSKIDAFRQFLMDNDFNFKEKTNGHFQLFDDSQKLQYQVWATTEKLLGTAGQSAVGTGKIQRVLTDWWEGLKQPVEAEKVENTSIPENVTVVQLSDLRVRFQDCYNSNKGHMFDCILVTAVHLPSGATEIATNHYEVEDKMAYILNAYDENMKLKTNPAVQMTGFMLV